MRVLETMDFLKIPNPIPYYLPKDHDKFQMFVGSKLSEVYESIQGNSNATIPEMYLVNLSKITCKRKVVTIFVSGFLSEDFDKKSEWKEIADEMNDSEIYALKWNSSNLPEMTKFMGTTVKDIALAKGTGGLFGKCVGMAD